MQTLVDFVRTSDADLVVDYDFAPRFWVCHAVLDTASRAIPRLCLDGQPAKNHAALDAASRAQRPYAENVSTLDSASSAE